MPKQFEPWSPEVSNNALLEDSTAIVYDQDPRVITSHQPGQMPVPANPPPPVGWEYWGKQPIPHAAASIANDILHKPGLCPMGTFVRISVNGQLIGLRVEWHNLQGATGKKGCFRGVNLMRKVSDDV